MAIAALAVLAEAVQTCAMQLEPYADRLLPKVAWRLVDAKAGIREATQEVMIGAYNANTSRVLLQMFRSCC